MTDKHEAHTFDSDILSDIQEIISTSKAQAIRSIDFQRVLMYWQIGQRIVVEEQDNQERAAYGIGLLKKLGEVLDSQYGGGFSERSLRLARQLYLTYPIRNALRSELNWLQYRLLIRINDPEKREYYALEAVNNHWTGRELERQINSLLYERLLMSADKESVLQVARKQRVPTDPREIIKDPMVLEFLGLSDQSAYHESQLETALINHLEAFMLELGNGFSFVARQKRIILEDEAFFIDLVFYNRLLRAHVIVEIKTRKLTHGDLGQLQMYVNYYDRVEKLADEQPTIGILLCTEKNDSLVKFALPETNRTILASKYEVILPSEERLLAEIAKVETRLAQERQKPSSDSVE